MKQKPGYTLLEALLVLGIAALFLLIPVLCVQKWQQKSCEAWFISSFEKRLTAVQQAAITRRTRTWVFFYEEAIYFSGLNYDASQESIGLLAIPEGIEYRGPRTLVFNAVSGNNSSLNKLSFSLPKRKFKLEYQFQLGSGKHTKKIVAI